MKVFFFFKEKNFSTKFGEDQKATPCRCKYTLRLKFSTIDSESIWVNSVTIAESFASLRHVEACTYTRMRSSHSDVILKSK